MSVDVSGRALARVEAGEFALDLHIDAGWFVRIESDHELQRPGAAPLRSRDGEGDQIAAWLRGQIGRKIVAFDYGERADLVIGFPDGALRVPPDENYEAWSLVGPRKERVISMPGGELAIWSAERRPRT